MPRRASLIPRRSLSPRNNHSLSTFVVGISGHRDLHPAARPQLREAVSAILEQLAERLPDCELRIMAGMAAGADLLVVQTGLELGLGVDALLPMPLPQYAADFDGESFVLLQTLLAPRRLDVHPRSLNAYHRDGQRLNDGEAVPVPGDS